MLKKVIRLLTRLAVMAILVVAGRAALKRWIDGPEPTPSAGDGWAPAADPGPPATTSIAPAEVSDGAEPAPPRKNAGSGPKSRSGSSGPTGRTPSSGNWVAPDESGAAPSTHPVKVKLSSGIYREPGSSGYDRSRPDRCYPSAEAAEADGFVRAKR